MKKLNNKGISIVELIIVFIVLMVLVFGMMSIVMKLKERSTTIKFEKEMLEYKTLLTKTIQKDLIENKVTIDVCSEMSCTIKLTNEENEEITKNLSLNKETFTITYDGINYEIPEKDLIEFGDITTIANVNESYFTINIPYYEMKYSNSIDPNSRLNYGISIVYPLGLDD